MKSCSLFGVYLIRRVDIVIEGYDYRNKFINAHHRRKKVWSDLDHLVNRLHHQMDVNVCSDTVISQGLANHRADCEVGHIMVVYIMHPRNSS